MMLENNPTFKDDSSFIFIIFGKNREKTSPSTHSMLTQGNFIGDFKTLISIITDMMDYSKRYYFMIKNNIIR